MQLSELTIERVGGAGAADRAARLAAIVAWSVWHRARHAAAMLLLILAAMAGAPSAVPAGAADAVACGQRYAAAPAIALRSDAPAAVAIAAAFRPERVWGVAENVRILSAAAGEPTVLEVRYPEGSIAPSSGAPRGGAGFVSRAGLEHGVEAACLSYRVRFAPGFAFARGGKLPGLFGGDGPVGGAAADAGFSTRLMWRQDGLGELYAYVPERASRHGLSLGRGAWRFPVGRWVTVEQELVLNDPSLADGIARIWIDGVLRFEATGLVFRRDPEVRIAGLMFSTFFGGSDPSWASPMDQQAQFAAFSLQVPRDDATPASWAALRMTASRVATAGS
jgi:hypothetical protein